MTFDDFSKWLLIAAVLACVVVVAIWAILRERTRRSKLTPEQREAEDIDNQFWNAW